MNSAMPPMKWNSVDARRIFALVGQRDLQALVQERQLAQPLASVSKLNFVASMMDVSGLKVILVPVFLPALPVLASGALGTPLAYSCSQVQPFAPDFELQRFRERIHAAHADAVQSARNFVRVRIELAAGVQLGHHHLRRGDAFFFVHVHGNAAAVVDHGHRIVVVDGDVDLGAVTRQRFVHRVVDHFVDQVMQTRLRRSSRCTSRAAGARPPGPPAL